VGVVPARAADEDEVVRLKRENARLKCELERERARHAAELQTTPWTTAGRHATAGRTTGEAEELKHRTGSVSRRRERSRCNLLNTNILEDVAASDAGPTSLSEARKARDERARRQEAAFEEKSPPPNEESQFSLERTVPSAKEGLQTLLQRFYLRRAVIGENGIGGIADPAEISYVHPGEGNDSYAINAGVGANFSTVVTRPTVAIDWGAGIEYHRDTDVSKRMDLLKTALIANATLGDANTSEEKMRFWRVQGSVGFNNDNVSNLQAISTHIDAYPVYGACFIDDQRTIETLPLPFRWQPKVGLAYEHSTSTAAGADQGERLLIKYGVRVESYPLHLWVKRTVQFNLDLMANSIPTATNVYRPNKDWNAYLRADLTYWFRPPDDLGDKQQFNFGIGITYERGDDPEMDIAHQDLLTLSLRAKY
jgi:hypothetical protein